MLAKTYNLDSTCAVLMQALFKFVPLCVLIFVLTLNSFFKEPAPYNSFIRRKNDTTPIQLQGNNNSE